MRKKFRKAVLICVGVMFFSVNANALEDIKFYENILKNGDYSFVVEGYVPSHKTGENVNIIILNPGYDLKNEEERPGNEYLQYQDSVMSGENGYFRIEAPVYLDGINDSGEYTCYVGGEAFEEAQRLEPLYFASIESRKASIKKLKESLTSEKVLENLEEAEKNLSLCGELYSAVDKNKLAVLIYENRNSLSEEKIAESTKIIKSLMLLEAYNENLTQYIHNSYEFLNTELIDFSKADENGADLYSNGYTKILNSEGKKKVIQSLVGRDFKNEYELINAFKESVVIYGIKNCSDSGNGHIEKLLKAENAETCGLNIPIYLSLSSDSQRSKAADEIISASFNTIVELQTAVEKAAENAQKKSLDGTGSTGGKNTGSASGSKNDISAVIIGNNDIDEIINNINTEKTVFRDLENYQWAEEAIMYLYEKKIISGVSTDRFAPGSSVTREQFVVMLLRAFNIPLSEDDATFEDVVSGSYYEKYINTAKKIGIVNGVSQDCFGVGKNLSRQDMSVIIKNTAGITGRELTVKTDMIVFNDSGEIRDYAAEAVESLVRAGIINGFEDNTFRPSENCTRAQAAKIIYELVKGADEND